MGLFIVFIQEYTCSNDLYTSYPLTGPVHSIAISTPWGAYSTAAIEGADH